MTTMTTAIDPLLGVTPAQHADTLGGIVLALLADAERFSLRPTDLNVHRELGSTSAAVQFGSDPASVDALAAAYGLPPAAPDGGLYGRTGPVTIDNEAVTVLLYAARPAGPPALPAAPETPTGGGPVPAVPGGPAIQVESARADQ